MWMWMCDYKLVLGLWALLSGRVLAQQMHHLGSIPETKTKHTKKVLNKHRVF